VQCQFRREVSAGGECIGGSAFGTYRRVASRYKPFEDFTQPHEEREMVSTSESPLRENANRFSFFLTADTSLLILVRGNASTGNDGDCGYTSTAHRPDDKCATIVVIPRRKVSVSLRLLKAGGR